MEVKTLSIFEKVDFPQYGIKSIIAKIDSGADTGALHCTKITEEKTKDGPILHFSPFDYPELKISTSDFYMDDVKSSNGSSERRYFISTFILVQGETYQISISLADRSKMTYPMLIGRRFLSNHNFLVDVNKVTDVSFAEMETDKK
jgi:hypothetical protein